MGRIGDGVSQAEFYTNLKAHFGSLQTAFKQLGSEVDLLKSNSLLLAKELEHQKETTSKQDGTKEIWELRTQNALLASEVQNLKDRLDKLERKSEWSQNHPTMTVDHVPQAQLRLPTTGPSGTA